MADTNTLTPAAAASKETTVTNPDVASSAPWKPRVNPWLIAMTVALAAFMEVLDTSIANVALPHIAGSLGASTDEGTWVLTSYLVSNAIVLPLGGWASSVIGRRNFFVFCITIFTVSSFLCGAAPSLPMLLLFRVIQGAGGGGLQPMAQAIMADSFEPHKRGQAFALYGLVAVLAPSIGPTLGGWITDNFSWRWIFYINIPVGILAFILVTRLVEDPPWIKADRSRFFNMDYVGLGFLTIAMGGMQIMLDKGEENDWFASNFICFFAFLFVAGMIAPRLVGVAAKRSAHQPQGFPLQKFRHLLLPHDAGRRRAQRQHRPPAAVHAATARLDRHHRRPRAHRRRLHAGHHDAPGRHRHRQGFRAHAHRPRLPPVHHHLPLCGRRHHARHDLCAGLLAARRADAARCPSASSPSPPRPTSACPRRTRTRSPASSTSPATSAAASSSPSPTPRSPAAPCGTSSICKAPWAQLPSAYQQHSSAPSPASSAAAFGGPNGAGMALANIYNQLNLQAGVQGYQDVYMELSYMSIFLVFLAFLLSKNKPGQGAGGGAMH